MGMSGGGDDHGMMAEINVTPFVDVMLVLLIIFMITAPMLVQGANVNLPQTRPMDKLPSGNIFLNVTEDFEIFMNEDETSSCITPNSFTIHVEPSPSISAHEEAARAAPPT